MGTRSKRQSGAAMVDVVLFGLALVLLALPLPVLLGRFDIGLDRLALLVAIVAIPAVTLLFVHRRASRTAERPAAPAPPRVVASLAPADDADEPTLDPAEISASLAASPPPAPARPRRRPRASVAPSPCDVRDPAA